MKLYKSVSKLVLFGQSIILSLYFSIFDYIYISYAHFFG
jgi:hypothetical protein